MSRTGGTIADLADRSTHDLRLEWRRHHRGDTPESLSRDLLLRSLAYRFQEQANGGLSQRAKRSLALLGERADRDEAVTDGIAAEVMLRPGLRLVRGWHSQTHTVLVLSQGFEYRDVRYRSLTQIAKHITGAHWSGPRFFGLARGPAIAGSDNRSPGIAAGASDHGQT